MNHFPSSNVPNPVRTAAPLSLAAAFIAVALLMATGARPAAGQDARSATQPGEKDTPAQDSSDEPADGDDKEPNHVYVQMTTSKGEIILELNRKEAPISVENFLRYVEDEFYDGTIFHRVVAHFMIQGGGYTTDMTKKPTREPIANEWENDLNNDRGTIAMARLGGQPDSATSQFFINVADNAFLDRPQRDGAGYAVFGKVYAGMDTVAQIRNVAVKPSPLNGERSFPQDMVVIEKMRTISEDEAKKLKQKMDQPAEESADEPDDETGERQPETQPEQ